MPVEGLAQGLQRPVESANSFSVDRVRGNEPTKAQRTLQRVESARQQAIGNDGGRPASATLKQQASTRNPFQYLIAKNLVRSQGSQAHGATPLSNNDAVRSALGIDNSRRAGQSSPLTVSRGGEAFTPSQLPDRMPVLTSSLPGAGGRDGSSTLSQLPDTIPVLTSTRPRVGGHDGPSTPSQLPDTIPVLVATQPTAGRSDGSDSDQVADRAASLAQRVQALEIALLSAEQGMQASAGASGSAGLSMSEEVGAAMSGSGAQPSSPAISLASTTPFASPSVNVGNGDSATFSLGERHLSSVRDLRTSAEMSETLADGASANLRDALKDLGLTPRQVDRIVNLTNETYANSMMSSDSVDYVAGSHDNQSSPRPVTSSSQEAGYYPEMGTAQSSQAGQAPQGYPSPQADGAHEEERPAERPNAAGERKSKLTRLMDRIRGKTEDANDKPLEPGNTPVKKSRFKMTVIPSFQDEFVKAAGVEIDKTQLGSQKKSSDVYGMVFDELFTQSMEDKFGNNGLFNNKKVN